MENVLIQIFKNYNIKYIPESLNDTKINNIYNLITKSIIL